MADQRLRELTREDGLAAEVRALQERVRLGEVPHEIVELAAYCGSRVAGLVLGLSICRACGCYESGEIVEVCGRCHFDLWVDGLIYDKLRPKGPLRTPRYGFEPLILACVAAERAVQRVPVFGHLPEPDDEILAAMDAAERFVLEPNGLTRAAWTEAVADTVLPLRLVKPSWVMGRTYRVTLDECAEIAGSNTVRTAIEERLIAWALGGTS